MFQIRIHGRGGQGVVTAAEMLSVAGFLGDKYTQAFPSFHSERMGAPVVSYCRIDEPPIRTHDPNDYCKGCGICVAECPYGAITMEPESI